MLNWKTDKIARAAQLREPPSNHPTHRRSDVASTHRTCSIPDCGRPFKARGWCKMHHTRWLRHGSEHFRLKRQIAGPADVRFWAKVDKRGPDECWLWLSSLFSNGYGSFWDGATNVRAHRYAYELEHGPIPNGKQLDHLCRTRTCVNPGHLEAVDQRINTLRGNSFSAVNARKTHCAKGHLYDLLNTYFRPKGGRECLTCMRARNKRRYQTGNVQ